MVVRLCGAPLLLLSFINRIVYIMPFTTQQSNLQSMYVVMVRFVLFFKLDYANVRVGIYIWNKFNLLYIVLIRNKAKQLFKIIYSTLWMRICDYEAQDLLLLQLNFLLFFFLETLFRVVLVVLELSSHSQHLDQHLNLNSKTLTYYCIHFFHQNKT